MCVFPPVFVTWKGEDRMRQNWFHYRSPEEIRADADRNGVHLPLAQDAGILWERLAFGNVTLQNRIGIAPMEGVDSLPSGAPSDLTFRRYRRFARGGAGLVWLEATAPSPAGRSHGKQLMLTEETLGAFQRLSEAVHEEGLKANGFRPYLVIQAHAAGRMAEARPVVGRFFPERDRNLRGFTGKLASDDELKRTEEELGDFARLAKRAGFDAVEIKCCHGYLLGEMLSAYERPGPYGGSYENRTRLFRNSVKAAKAYEDDDFLVTARLGIYDGLPRPYGFGVGTGGGTEPDMTEPVCLVRELRKEGMPFLNLSLGLTLTAAAEKNPIADLARIAELTGQIKKAVPEMTVSGTAFSYFRQFAGLHAAGCVEEGVCDHTLFGRMAFADPEFPLELRDTGGIDPGKTCLACGGCGRLIGSRRPTGCIVRDQETYPVREE